MTNRELFIAGHWFEYQDGHVYRYERITRCMLVDKNRSMVALVVDLNVDFIGWHVRILGRMFKGTIAYKDMDFSVKVTLTEEKHHN